MIDYDPHLVEEVGARLDLRAPNKAALVRIAEVLGEATGPVEVVCDLATAVGKTYIAAGLIDYLAASGVRNVLIVTPGTTIQNKTIGNFTPGHPKFVHGMATTPLVVTVDDYRRGSVGSALDDDETFKLFVFNVQQLIKPKTKVSRKVRSYDETLGDDLYSHLQSARDLVVIADEHHVYNPHAAAFSSAVRELDPVALVGLTATPHEKTPSEAIIFHYTLAEAIADGFVKIPVLVGRSDGHKDARTQLADGCQLLRAKTQAVEAYAQQVGVEAVNPVMLVVCADIAEADQMAELLAADDMIGSANGVLTITSQSSDEALELLDQVEQPSSPVKAIVSVQMLKEGWDVKNIYVICALRALESEALTEQILGRGLRLPFGRRTGVMMLDTVEVISHRRFKSLLDRAEILLEAVVPERAGEAQPIIDLEMAAESGRAEFGIPASGPDGSTDGAGGGTDLIMAIEEMGQRQADAEQQVLSLRQPMVPNPDAPRIKFPLLKTVIRPAVFSLSDIGDHEAQELGQKFLTEFNVNLNRVAVDAQRTAEGIKVTRESLEGIEATQLRLPVEDLASRLTAGVFGLDLVTQERKEKGAAKRLVAGFLSGAGVVADDEAATWTEARAAAAVAAFRNMVRERFRSRPSRSEQEFSSVPYPPATQLGPGETFGRHDASRFVRGRYYDGWKRSILAAVAFDAKSTEFVIAELLDDATADIAWWTRVENHDGVYIEWGNGSKYFPDFIAIDNNRVHWLIEGKSDKEAPTRDVQAKKSSAERWARHVNDSGEFDVEWRYLFVTEAHLKQATAWGSLLSVAS